MQLSILLLTIDRAAADSLTTALSKPGHGVTVVSDAVDLFATAAGYSLVMIDRVAPPLTVAAVVEELRRDDATAKIPVLAIAQADDIEERIGLLESGADDVITKPFDPVELEARVEAVSLRFQRSLSATPVPTLASASIGDPNARRIISVFSPKGGVGTTMIATNIAIVAASKKPERVVLLDLDLQFGGVAAHLDIEPKQTLADAARDVTALRAAELLRGYAVKHGTGLHVLCAPPTPELAELVTPETVKNLLATLTSGYDHVIIDAGSVLDERTMLVLESADTVVIPVWPEIPALKAVHSFLDFLNETGTLSSKAVFVLNNAFARDILKPRDVEIVLGTKIVYDLPYDPFLYLKAVNEGVPVVLGAAESPAAQRLVKLAATVFGEDGSAVPAAEPTRRGLFAGLRRRT